MRSKVEAHDYRYFPEPDLAPLNISRKWVKEIAGQLPELPEAKRRHYVEDLGLAIDDAYVLVEFKELSDFLDKVLKLGTAPKAAANWITGSILAYLNDNKLELSSIALIPENLHDLIAAIDKGTLGSTTAKQVLLVLLQKGGNVNEVIEREGLAQVSDEQSLKKAVELVLSSNPTQLADYRQGKTKLRQFFVGQVMKATTGKANPKIVDQLLDELL